MSKEIRCCKCNKITEIEVDDMWQGELEDVADGNLSFRFTGYCENEIVDKKNPENWEECGAVIEVIRYATLREHMDIEQEGE